jgi:hypothetical protein
MARKNKRDQETKKGLLAPGTADCSTQKFQGAREMNTNRSSTTNERALPSLLRFTVLDPSPDGHVLSNDVIEQALADFAGLSAVAVLEPIAVAMIAGRERVTAVRQHRFALLVEDDAVGATLGHLEAYAATILPGHPVTVELSQVGMMGN